jgi:hypothetical protein
MQLKLTIQAVAKMTGLSESMVRQYAWEKKLGKLEGRTKVFTLAEARKLGGPRSASAAKKERKKPTAKKAARVRPRKAVPAKVVGEPPKTDQKQPLKERRSFWAFLGIGRKPRAKVSIMQASIKE